MGGGYISYPQSGGGGGGGGVTSVGLAMPSTLFNVTGSPVTTSGTLSGVFKNITANYFLVGPTSGSAAAPTMRLLVNGDFPSSLSLSITGLNLSGLTISTALAVDGSGNLASSTTTGTELGYVHGVTSAIQTQLNAKQASGSYITALTGDVTASGPGSSTATLAATTNATLTTLSALTSVGTIGTGVWHGTIIGATYGGTGNGFTAFTGPASSTKTFTLPNASDTVACLGQVNAFTQQTTIAAAALTPGSTVAWNMNTAPNATLAPTANFTLSNPSNIVAGGSGMLTITQPATGGPAVITWSSAYRFAGGTKFTLSVAANAVDEIAWYSPDGTHIDCVGQAAFA